MFLSGKTGSGKNHVIKTILAFLRMFYNKCDVPFYIEILKATAYTSVVAAQFKIPGATTIHGAAHLNSKSPKRYSFYWVDTIIVFVD